MKKNDSLLVILLLHTLLHPESLQEFHLEVLVLKKFGKSGISCFRTPRFHTEIRQTPPSTSPSFQWGSRFWQSPEIPDNSCLLLKCIIRYWGSHSIFKLHRTINIIFAWFPITIVHQLASHSSYWGLSYRYRIQGCSISYLTSKTYLIIANELLLLKNPYPSWGAGASYDDEGSDFDDKKVQ